MPGEALMLDDGMEKRQEGLTGLSGCLSTCHLNKASEQPESASPCRPQRLGEVSVGLEVPDTARSFAVWTEKPTIWITQQDNNPDSDRRFVSASETFIST